MAKLRRYIWKALYWGSWLIIVLAGNEQGVPPWWLMLIVWVIVGIPVVLKYKSLKSDDPWKSAALSMLIPGIIIISARQYVFYNLFDFLEHPTGKFLVRLVWEKAFELLVIVYLSMVVLFSSNRRNDSSARAVDTEKRLLDALHLTQNELKKYKPAED